MIYKVRAALFGKKVATRNVERYEFIDNNVCYPVFPFYAEKIQSDVRWRIVALEYIKRILGERWSTDDGKIIRLFIRSEDEKESFNNNRELRVKIKKEIELRQKLMDIALEIFEMELIIYNNHNKQNEETLEKLSGIFKEIKYFILYSDDWTDFWNKRITDWNVELNKIQIRDDYRILKRSFYALRKNIVDSLDSELKIYRDANYLASSGFDPFWPNDHYRETVVFVKFIVMRKLLNDEEIQLMCNALTNREEPLKVAIKSIMGLFDRFRDLDKSLYDKLLSSTIEIGNTTEIVQEILTFMRKIDDCTEVDRYLDHILAKNGNDLATKKVEARSMITNLIELYTDCNRKIAKISAVIFQVISSEFSQIHNRSLEEIKAVESILNIIDYYASGGYILFDEDHIKEIRRMLAEAKNIITESMEGLEGSESHNRPMPANNIDTTQDVEMMGPGTRKHKSVKLFLMVSYYRYQLIL